MLSQYPDINKAKEYLTILKKAKNGEKASIICLYNEFKEQFDSLVTTNCLTSEIQERCVPRSYFLKFDLSICVTV